MPSVVEGSGRRRSAALLAIALAGSGGAVAQERDAAAPAAPEAAPAQAAAPAAAREDLVPLAFLGFTGALHASYRLIGWAQPGLQLGRADAQAPIDTLGKKTFLEHRLRVGAGLRRDAVELRFEADLLNGLLRALPGGYVLPPAASAAGAVPQPDLADPLRNRDWGTSPSSFALRELAIRWRTSAGQLTLGATTFHFGQGMLINPAADPLDAEAGDQRFGDRVVRLAFSTRPLQLAMGEGAPDLTVGIGADLVLQDSTATLFRPLADWSGQGALRDRAYGGFLALLHEAEGRSLGLFVTRRAIHPPDAPVVLPGTTQPFSTDVQAWALDAEAALRRPLEGGGELYAAAEGALVLGDADRVRNATCQGQTDADRCRLRQGGAVLRAGIRGGLVGFDLLGGFASGDANPFDDQVNNFQMSRDFEVGLILFDQVLAWQTAATVRRAIDPKLSAVPAPGVELLSTNGAVTNALFLQPTVKLTPMAGLQLFASLLSAVAPQPVTDVYWVLKSGAATNSFGQPAGKGYGFELDAGANWRHQLRPGLQLAAGLAGGLFLPGDAFVVDAAGNKMDPVTRLKARAAISF